MIFVCEIVTLSTSESMAFLKTAIGGVLVRQVQPQLGLPAC